MTTPKLLIVDENEDFRLALMGAMQCDFTVRSCGSGKTALNLLHSFQPDILVLDLILPELDGLSLLQSAAVLEYRPKVLVVTRLYTEYVLDAAEALGIKYVMRKPCSIANTAARIRSICAESSRPKPDIDVLLQKLLKEHSVPDKLDGYTFIYRSLPVLMDEPTACLAEKVYPLVCRNTRFSEDNVARSIRTAIEAAWDQRDPAVWEKLFPDCKKRPANRVFLTRLATELKRRMDEE